MPGFAVTGRDGIPLWHRTWALWRDHIREERMADPSLFPDATLDYCVTCAGNGRILDPAGNGEGLIPADCPTCEGRGRG